MVSFGVKAVRACIRVIVPVLICLALSGCDDRYCPSDAELETWLFGEECDVLAELDRLEEAAMPKEGTTAGHQAEPRETGNGYSSGSAAAVRDGYSGIGGTTYSIEVPSDYSREEQLPQSAAMAAPSIDRGPRVDSATGTTTGHGPEKPGQGHDMEPERIDRLQETTMSWSMRRSTVRGFDEPDQAVTSHRAGSLRSNGKLQKGEALSQVPLAPISSVAAAVLQPKIQFTPQVYYPSPAKMYLNKPSPYEVQISLNPQIDQAIRRHYEAMGPHKRETIEVADYMIACLEGDPGAFDIEEPKKKPQKAKGNRSGKVIWVWYVTPKKLGTHYLYLKIMPYTDDQVSIHSEPGRPITVTVDIWSFLKIASDWLTQNLELVKWLVGGFSAWVAWFIARKWRASSMP